MHFLILYITRDNVLQEMHEQLIERIIRIFVLLFNKLSDHENIKVVLKNTTDLLRAIVEQKETTIVYVIDKDMIII